MITCTLKTNNLFPFPVMKPLYFREFKMLPCCSK